MSLESTLQAIQPPDWKLLAQAQVHLDRLTKPVGSLGRLEDLAGCYVAIRGELAPAIPEAMVMTLAADHGVVAEGVSAYPSSVTAQMVENFLVGGAAVNVLARHVHAQVRIVDMGVASNLIAAKGLIVKKIGHGTQNFTKGPAMSREEAIQALDVGIGLAKEAYDEGIRLLAIGDMGIGNSTSSAAISAVMTGHPVAAMTGRGTGLDDVGWVQKVKVIEEALACNHPQSHDAIDVLSKVGGYEIGGMAGIILGAASCRIPIVLDGFIAGASALLAVGLQPVCRDFFVASHLSVEQGHRLVLEHLKLQPLLDLQLRLGEGTGACLAIGLIQASLKIYREMATFEDAKVDGALSQKSGSSVDS